MSFFLLRKLDRFSNRAPRCLSNTETSHRGLWTLAVFVSLLALGLLAGQAQTSTSLPEIDGQKAYDYTRQVVDIGPRPTGSAAHKRTEQFIISHLRQDNADIISYRFIANTPNGVLPMRNIVGKFRGDKDGVIVIAGHFDTKNMDNFVGASDGGSSTGILLAIADALKSPTRHGDAVWVVFLDGEEAVKDWTDADSLYGSRDLAKKWDLDGTAKKIKAFILADMIGAKNLQIEDDSNSDPGLKQLISQAARMYGTQSHFFVRENGIGDDHIPFTHIGVPAVDLIDFNYPAWHTTGDTMDKLSVESFQIVGDVILQTIRLIEQHRN
jgi:Zn-dependent M28 family amino/carboxypeptidase